MPADWFYAQNGQQLGPIDDGHLHDLATSGQLRRSDLVWRDGMPNWTPAGNLPELFPPEVAQAMPIPVAPLPPPGPAPAYAASRSSYAAPSTVAPEGSAPKGGMSVLALVLIFGGIAFALLLVVGGIITIVLAFPNMFGAGNPRTFSLASGRENDTPVYFKTGTRVEVWVTSVKDSDVDLFILDPNRVEIARDIGPSKDCHLLFVAPASGTYTLKVVNRVLRPDPFRRNMTNRCTLRWEPQ